MTFVLYMSVRIQGIRVHLSTVIATGFLTGIIFSDDVLPVTKARILWYCGVHNENMIKNRILPIFQSTYLRQLGRIWHVKHNLNQILFHHDDWIIYIHILNIKKEESKLRVWNNSLLMFVWGLPYIIPVLLISYAPVILCWSLFDQYKWADCVSALVRCDSIHQLHNTGNQSTRGPSQ